MITIKDPLRAFSHQPGHCVLMPGTLFVCKVYPTCLEVIPLKDGKSSRFFWDLKGPVDPFTVEQDVMQRVLRIYGQAKEGYFRFVLKIEGRSFVLKVEKAPVQGVFFGGDVCKTLFPSDALELVSDLDEVQGREVKETLFLGSNKQKNWDLIRQRKDLKEVFPLWYALGMMSTGEGSKNGPIFDLLDSCQEKIKQKDKSVYETFLALYLAGFTAGLIPRSYDDEYQGILPMNGEKANEAICLLREGALVIRSLFFQEKGSDFYIHPCLPSEFVSGKMIGLATSCGALVDMEWTKHKLRQMSLLGGKKEEIRLCLPKDIKRFRVRKRLKEKGNMLQNGESIFIKERDRVFLDRFER